MILLTGGSGRLGRQLRPLIGPHCAPTHGSFDVEHPGLIPDYVSLVVHCAAWTRPAETVADRVACWGVNALGTLSVALAAEAAGVPFVHVTDRSAPAGCYARSKGLAERLARRCKRAVVVEGDDAQAVAWAIQDAACA